MYDHSASTVWTSAPPRSDESLKASRNEKPLAARMIPTGIPSGTARNAATSKPASTEPASALIQPPTPSSSGGEAKLDASPEMITAIESRVSRRYKINTFPVDQ